MTITPSSNLSLHRFYFNNNDVNFKNELPENIYEALKKIGLIKSDPHNNKIENGQACLSLKSFKADGHEFVYLDVKFADFGSELKGKGLLIDGEETDPVVYRAQYAFKNKEIEGFSFFDKNAADFVPEYPLSEEVKEMISEHLMKDVIPLFEVK